MKKYHNVQSEVWKSVFGLAFSAPLFDRYAVDEVIACNQMQGQPTAIVRGAIDVIYALTKGTPTPLQSFFSVQIMIRAQCLSLTASVITLYTA